MQPLSLQRESLHHFILMFRIDLLIYQKTHAIELVQ
jgi:hypothetical protein